jgi:hypothetical protein
MDELDGKRALLRRELEATGGVMVAFSGGADSTFLLAAAVEALGERAVAATGVSPSLAERELADARALAAALRGLLGRLKVAARTRAPYNLVLHTAPPGVEDFHWHLHLLPRLTTFGGFELGTGIVINVVDPDRAAEALRAAPPEATAAEAAAPGAAAP